MTTDQLLDLKKRLADAYTEALKKGETKLGDAKYPGITGILQEKFKDIANTQEIDNQLRASKNTDGYMKSDELTKLRQTEALMDRMKDSPNYIGQPRTHTTESEQPKQAVPKQEEPQLKPTERFEDFDRKKVADSAFGDSFRHNNDSILKTLTPPRSASTNVGASGNPTGFQLNPAVKGQTKEDIEDKTVPSILENRAKAQAALEQLKADRAKVASLPADQQEQFTKQLDEHEKLLQRNLKNTEKFDADIANWKFRRSVDEIRNKAAGIDGDNVIIPNQRNNAAQLDVNFYTRLHDLVQHEKKNGTLDVNITDQDIADGIMGGTSIIHSLLNDGISKFKDKYKNFFDTYDNTRNGLSNLQGEYLKNGSREKEQDYTIPDTSNQQGGDGKATPVVPRVQRGVSVPMSNLAWGFNEGGTIEGTKRAQADLWQNASEVTFGALAKPLAGLYGMIGGAITGIPQALPSQQEQYKFKQDVEAVGSTLGRVFDAFSGTTIGAGIGKSIKNAVTGQGDVFGNGDGRVFKDILNGNFYKAPTAEETKAAVLQMAPGAEEAMKPADNFWQTVMSEMSKGVMSIGFGELAAAGKLSTLAGEGIMATKAGEALRVSKLGEAIGLGDEATILANRVAKELNVTTAEGARTLEQVIEGTAAGRQTMNLAKTMVPVGSSLADAAHLATTIAIQTVAQNSDHLTIDDIKQGVKDGSIFAVANYGLGKFFGTVAQRTAMLNKAGAAPEIAARLNKVNKYSNVFALMGASVSSSKISKAFNDGKIEDIFDINNYANRHTVIDLFYGALGFKELMNARGAKEYKNIIEEAPYVSAADFNNRARQEYAKAKQQEPTKQQAEEPTTKTGNEPPTKQEVPDLLETIIRTENAYTPKKIGTTEIGSDIVENSAQVLERLANGNNSIRNVTELIANHPEVKVTPEENHIIQTLDKVLGKGMDNTDGVRFLDKVMLNEGTSLEQRVPAKLGADGRIYIDKGYEFKPGEVLGNLVEEKVHKAVSDRVKNDVEFRTNFESILNEFKNTLSSDKEAQNFLVNLHEGDAARAKDFMDYHLGDLTDLHNLNEGIAGLFNRNTGFLETMKYLDAKQQSTATEPVKESLYRRFLNAIQKIFSKGKTKEQVPMVEQVFELMDRLAKGEGTSVGDEFGAAPHIIREFSGSAPTKEDLANEEMRRGADIINKLVNAERHSMLDKVIKATEANKKITESAMLDDVVASSAVKSPIDRAKVIGRNTAIAAGKDWNQMNALDRMKSFIQGFTQASYSNKEQYRVNKELLGKAEEFIGKETTYEPEQQSGREMIKDAFNITNNKYVGHMVNNLVRLGSEGYEAQMSAIAGAVISNSKNKEQTAVTFDEYKRRLYRTVHNQTEQVPVTLNMSKGTIVPIQGNYTENHSRVRRMTQQRAGFDQFKEALAESASQPQNDNPIMQSVIADITTSPIRSIQQTTEEGKGNRPSRVVDGLDKFAKPEQIYEAAKKMLTNPNQRQHFLLVPNGLSGNVVLDVSKSFDSVLGNFSHEQQIKNLHEFENSHIWSVLDNNVIQGDAQMQGRYGNMPKFIDALKIHKLMNIDGRTVESLTVDEVLQDKHLNNPAYNTDKGRANTAKAFEEKKPLVTAIADKLKSIYRNAHGKPFAPFSYRYGTDTTKQKRDIPDQFMTLMMATVHKSIDPGGQQYIAHGAKKLSKYMEKYYGLYTSPSYNYYNGWDDMLVALGGNYRDYTDDDLVNHLAVHTDDSGTKYVKFAVMDIDAFKDLFSPEMIQLFGEVNTDGSALVFHTPHFKFLGDAVQAKTPGHIKTGNVNITNGLTTNYKGDLHFLDIEHYKDMAKRYPALEGKLEKLIALADNLKAQGIFGLAFSSTIKGKTAVQPGVSAEGFRYDQQRKVIAIPNKDGTVNTKQEDLDTLNLGALTAMFEGQPIPDYAIMRQDLHGKKGMGFILTAGDKVGIDSHALIASTHPRANNFTEYGRVTKDAYETVRVNKLREFAEMIRGAGVVNTIMNRFNASYQGKPRSYFDTDIQLNEQQRNAVDKVSKYINRIISDPYPFANDNQKTWFSVQGKAGTGKTTIINEILKTLPPNTPVYLGAFTHKASKVIEGKVGNTAKSVHSMLGLMVDDFGNIEQVTDDYGAPVIPIRAAKVVLIDESSMIDDNYLGKILESVSPGTAVVFFGDRGQLEGVDENKPSTTSPTFNTPYKAELTERVRQGEDSPILAYSDYFWNNSVSDNPVGAPDIYKKNNIGTTGALVFSPKFGLIDDKMVDLYRKGKELGDANYIRYVCYTNERRRQVNQYIHNKLYGSESNPFEVGETIAFNKPYKLSKGVKVLNSDEFKIVDGRSEIMMHGYKVYRYGIEYTYDEGDEQVTATVPVYKLHESERERYDKAYQELIDLNNKGTLSKSDKAEFKRLRSIDQDFDLTYAITSHKSQGSTYGTTIVDRNDIDNTTALSNKNKSQAVYTAITRSKYMTIMLDASMPQLPDDMDFSQILETIQTRTEPEAVQSVDGILQKKNIFTVTPINSKDEKATTKAILANKYIGYGEGLGENSSTASYAKQIPSKYVNTGTYSKNDVVFVSISGNRGDEKIRKQRQDETITEALKAIGQGATLLTDNEEYLRDNKYNSGEIRLAEALRKGGYTYSEQTIDNRIIGVWKNNNNSSADTQQNAIKEGVTELFDSTLEPINIYAGTKENANLSNFARRPFKLGDGRTYPSVEHAFQLEKLNYSSGYTEEEKNALIDKVIKGTAKEAKFFGRTIKEFDDNAWNENSARIMKDLMIQSFQSNPEALEALLATGKAKLTHKYNGVEQDKGRFSKVLMEVRQKLQPIQDIESTIETNDTSLVVPLTDQQLREAGTFLIKLIDVVEAAERQEHSGINPDMQVSKTVRLTIDETGRVIERLVPSLYLHKKLFGDNGLMARALADAKESALKLKTLGSSGVVMPGLADLADVYYLAEVALQQKKDEILDDIHKTFDTKIAYWRQEWNRLFNQTGNRVPFPYEFTEHHAKVLAEAYAVEQEAVIKEMIAANIDPATGQYADDSQGVTISVDIFNTLNRALKKYDLPQLTIGSKLFYDRTPIDEIDGFVPMYLMGLTPTPKTIITNKKLTLGIMGADGDGDEVGITIPSPYWVDDEGRDYFPILWHELTKLGVHTGVKNKEGQPAVMKALNTLYELGSEANKMVNLATAGAHPKASTIRSSPIEPGNSRKTLGTTKDLSKNVKKVDRLGAFFQNYNADFEKVNDRYELWVPITGGSVQMVFDEKLSTNFSLFKQIATVDNFTQHSIDDDDLFYGTFIDKVVIDGNKTTFIALLGNDRGKIIEGVDALLESQADEVLPPEKQVSTESRITALLSQNSISALSSSLPLDLLLGATPIHTVYRIINDLLEDQRYLDMEKVTAAKDVLSKLSYNITPLVSIPSADANEGWNYIKVMKKSQYNKSDVAVQIAMMTMLKSALLSHDTIPVQRQPLRGTTTYVTSDYSGVGLEAANKIYPIHTLITDEGKVELPDELQQHVESNDVFFDDLILNSIDVRALSNTEAGFLLGQIIANISKHYEGKVNGAKSADVYAGIFLMSDIEGTNIGKAKIANKEENAKGTLLSNKRNGSELYSDSIAILAGAYHNGVVPTNKDNIPLRDIIEDGIKEKGYQEFGAMSIGGDYKVVLTNKVAKELHKKFGGLDYSKLDNLRDSVEYAKDRFKQEFGGSIDEKDLIEILGALTPELMHEYILEKGDAHTQINQAANFIHALAQLETDLRHVKKELKGMRVGIKHEELGTFKQRLENFMDVLTLNSPHKSNNSISIAERLSQDKVIITHDEPIYTITHIDGTNERIEQVPYSSELRNQMPAGGAVSLVSRTLANLHYSYANTARIIDNGLWQNTKVGEELSSNLKETAPHFLRYQEAIEGGYYRPVDLRLKLTSKGTTSKKVKGTIVLSNGEEHHVDFNDIGKAVNEVRAILEGQELGVVISKTAMITDEGQVDIKYFSNNPPRYSRNNDPDSSTILPDLRHFTTEFDLNKGLHNAFTNQMEHVAGKAWALAKENALLNNQPIYVSDIPSQKHFVYNPDGTIEEVPLGVIQSEIDSNREKDTFHITSKLEDKYSDQQYHDYVATIHPPGELEKKNVKPQPVEQERPADDSILRENDYELLLRAPAEVEENRQRILDAELHLIFGQVESIKLAATLQEAANEIDFMMNKNDMPQDVKDYYTRTRKEMQVKINNLKNNTRNAAFEAMHEIDPSETVRAQKVLEFFVEQAEDNDAAWNRLARNLMAGHIGEIEHKINIRELKREVARAIGELKALNRVNSVTEAYKEQALKPITFNYTKESILAALGQQKLLGTDLANLLQNYASDMKHQITAAGHIALSKYATQRDPNRIADKIFTDILDVQHKGAELEVIDHNIMNHKQEALRAFNSTLVSFNPENLPMGVKVAVQYTNNVGEPIKVQGTFLTIINRSGTPTAVIVNTENRKAIYIGYDNMSIMRSVMQYSSTAEFKSLQKALENSAEVKALIQEVAKAGHLTRDKTGEQFSNKDAMLKPSSDLVNTIVELTKESQGAMSKVSNFGVQATVMGSYLGVGKLFTAFAKAGAGFGTSLWMHSPELAGYTIVTLAADTLGWVASMAGKIIENYVSTARVHNDIYPKSIPSNLIRMFSSKQGWRSLNSIFGGRALPSEVEDVSVGVAGIKHAIGSTQLSHELTPYVQEAISKIGNQPVSIGKQGFLKRAAHALGFTDKGTHGTDIDLGKYFKGRATEKEMLKYEKEIAKEIGTKIIETLAKEQQLVDMTSMAMKAGFDDIMEKGYRVVLVNGELKVTLNGKNADDVNAMRISLIQALGAIASGKVLTASEVHTALINSKIVNRALWYNDPSYAAKTSAQQARAVEEILKVTLGDYSNKAHFNRHGVGSQWTMFSNYYRANFLYKWIDSWKRLSEFKAVNALVGRSNDRKGEWIVQGKTIPNPNDQMFWWLVNGGIMSIGKHTLKTSVLLSMLSFGSSHIKHNTRVYGLIENIASNIAAEGQRNDDKIRNADNSLSLTNEFLTGNSYNQEGNRVIQAIGTSDPVTGTIAAVAEAIMVAGGDEHRLMNDNRSISPSKAKSVASNITSNIDKALQTLPLGVGQRAMINLLSRPLEMTYHEFYSSRNRNLADAEKIQDNKNAWEIGRAITNMNPTLGTLTVPLKVTENLIKEGKKK